MAWNDVMQGFGNFIDEAGTNLRNTTGWSPNLGLSEYLAGGKTSNSGSVNEGGFKNVIKVSDDNKPFEPPSPINPDVQYGGESQFDYGVGGGTSYSSAASAAQAKERADTLSYLDDQIARLNAQKARAEGGLGSGLANLEDSYNKNVSGVNQNRSRALEDFGVQREDTIRGKDKAIDTVNTNARVLSDSLRRRLGMASGADSSAYQITAPGAVARDASANRTGVVENFGENFRNLDTAENRAKTDFEQLLEELAGQKRTAESGLRSGIMNTTNDITTRLADAARQRALAAGGGYAQAKAASQPYEAEISQRESAIDNLFNQFHNPYQMREVKVDKPNLRDYIVDRTALNSNKQAGTQDPYAPYRPVQQREDEELL